MKVQELCQLYKAYIQVKFNAIEFDLYLHITLSCECLIEDGFN